MDARFGNAAMDPLVEGLLNVDPPLDGLTYGIVTQVSPLLVRVTGATGHPAVALRSYAPVLNDYVAVLVNGADRLVIGRVGGDSTAWNTVGSFGTGFTFGAGGAVKYRKMGDVVELWGELLTTAATAADAVAFTLPVGYRPPAGVYFVTPWYRGTPDWNWTYVVTSGNVLIAKATTGASQSLPLWGVRFPVSS